MMEPSRQRPVAKRKSRLVALIDEDTCTGCEVCIEFCPVDCITVIQTPNRELQNTVCRVIEEPCIGCMLCMRECPWECIRMVPKEPESL